MKVELCTKMKLNTEKPEAKSKKIKSGKKNRQIYPILSTESTQGKEYHLKGICRQPPVWYSI